MKIIDWIFRRRKLPNDVTPHSVAMSVANIGVEKTAGAFNINTGTLTKYMKTQGIPESVHGDVLSAVASIADEISGGINRLFEGSIPSGQREGFSMAAKHANTDDLIGDLIDKSVDLAVSKARPRATGKESKMERATKSAKELGLYSVLTQMFEHAFTYDNIILLAQYQGKTLKYLLPLDPVNVIIKPTYGFVDGKPGFKAFYKLSNDFVVAIRKGRIDKKNVPAHWLQAVRRGATIDGAVMKNWVELDETKGERVFIINRSGKRDRLIDTRMKRVFPLVNMRKAKLEGEFSVDFHIKSLIHQIVVDKNVVSAGRQVLYNAIQSASQSELDSIRDKYKAQMSKSIVEATTPEIEHKFHAPEFAKFSPPERYTKVEESIARNMGFSRVLMHGDSGSYASAYAHTKGLIARVEHWRTLVGELIGALLSESAKTSVTIGFNGAVLKESAQLLKETEFAVNNAIASLTTAGEDLGYTPEFENMRKEEEQKTPMLYIPIFEKSQGITAAVRWDANTPDGGDGEPGAPTTDGPQSKKDEKPDRPDA